MDNRINVEEVIEFSKRKEQLKYIIISSVGIFILFLIWILFLNKSESEIWRGFFTVVFLLLIVVLLVYGVYNLVKVHSNEEKYHEILTKYASLIEDMNMPENALVTELLNSGSERFGFDKILYHFWKDKEELVFFPVRPGYKTSKNYDRVQSVRLNQEMVRSFYITGEKFAKIELAENDNLTSTANKKENIVYRDTRETVIAYAVGDQTVYIEFSLNLYDKLVELLPKKENLDS